MFFNRRPKRDDKVRNTVARNIFALSFVYLFAKKIFVERAACKKADATVQRKYVHILPINCFPRWPRRLASAMGINVYSTSEQRETLLQEFWLGQQRLERRFPEVSLPMYVTVGYSVDNNVLDCYCANLTRRGSNQMFFHSNRIFYCIIIQQRIA